MKTPAHPKPTLFTGLWSRRVWPVLAGSTAALGVFAAIDTFGFVALLAIYAGLSMFSVVMVWGLAQEFGAELSAVARWGLSAALIVLVTMGLSLVHPVWGLLAGVAVGVTSPIALTLLARIRAGTTSRRSDPPARPAGRVLVDQAMVDRRFDEMVSQLMESGDFPDN
jgi:hypothetical protein